MPVLNEIGPLVLKKTMEIWEKIKKMTDDGYTYISIRKSLVNLDSGELDSGELDYHYMVEILPIRCKTYPIKSIKSIR